MPARCPELFVDKDTVSVGVGGDLKFSCHVQDLRDRGNQGSARWHRLACIIQCFVFLSFFGRFAFGLSLSRPMLSFPVGSWGREENL